MRNLPFEMQKIRSFLTARRFHLVITIAVNYFILQATVARSSEFENPINEIAKLTAFPGAFTAEWKVDRTLEADSKLAEEGYQLAIRGLEKKIKDKEALEIEKTKWREFYYAKYTKQSKNIIDVSISARNWNTLHAVVNWDGGKALHDYFITDGMGYRFVRNSRIQVPIQNIDDHFSAILVGIPSSFINSLLSSTDLKNVIALASLQNGIMSLRFNNSSSQILAEFDSLNRILSVEKQIDHHKLFRVEYTYGEKSPQLRNVRIPSEATVQFFNPNGSLYYSENWGLKTITWKDPATIKTDAPLLPGKNLEIDEHETISSDEIIKRLNE